MTEQERAQAEVTIRQITTVLETGTNVDPATAVGLRRQVDGLRRRLAASRTPRVFSASDKCVCGGIWTIRGMCARCGGDRLEPAKQEGGPDELWSDTKEEGV